MTTKLFKSKPKPRVKTWVELAREADLKRIQALKPGSAEYIEHQAWINQADPYRAPEKKQIRCVIL